MSFIEKMVSRLTAVQFTALLVTMFVALIVVNVTMLWAVCYATYILFGHTSGWSMIGLSLMAFIAGADLLNNALKAVINLFVLRDRVRGLYQD